MFFHRNENVGVEMISYPITVQFKRTCITCTPALELKQQDHAWWVGSRLQLCRFLIKIMHTVTDACTSGNSIFLLISTHYNTLEQHNSAILIWKHRNITCVIYRATTSLWDMKRHISMNCNGRGNILKPLPITAGGNTFAGGNISNAHGKTLSTSLCYGRAWPQWQFQKRPVQQLHLEGQLLVLPLDMCMQSQNSERVFTDSCHQAGCNPLSSRRIKHGEQTLGVTDSQGKRKKEISGYTRE